MDPFHFKSPWMEQCSDKLKGEFDPKNFLDKVPEKDASGYEVPPWKRLIVAKQLAEKAQADFELERKQKEAEERFKGMPAWRVALLEKKEKEKQNSNDIKDNASSKSENAEPVKKDKKFGVSLRGLFKKSAKDEKQTKNTDEKDSGKDGTDKPSSTQEQNENDKNEKHENETNEIQEGVMNFGEEEVNPVKPPMEPANPRPRRQSEQVPTDEDGLPLAPWQIELNKRRSASYDD